MRNTKVCLTLLLIWIFGSPLFAQPSNTWHSYYNSKKDLYGFKDAGGKIKISARFNALTRAWTFRNIIAVTEGRTNESYYLLKNGQKAGKDSLYIWDMSYDCEQEGTIRFRDPITDKVGFLGKDGKVIIPANYNDARPFYNGLALVIHKGKRVCADGKPYKADSCEHWYWDGITALINKNGTIQADSIDMAATENLNWYSLKVMTRPADTTLYTSFKAANNQVYTFINYEKEFKNWFYGHFSATLNLRGLQMNCFDEITVEGLFKHTLRKRYRKAAFLKQFNLALQKKMLAIKQRKTEIAIMSEDLNLFIYKSKRFNAFYTDAESLIRQNILFLMW